MVRRLLLGFTLATFGFLVGIHDARAGGGSCAPGFPVCGFSPECEQPNWCEAFECDSAECGEKEFLDYCYKCVPQP